MRLPWIAGLERRPRTRTVSPAGAVKHRLPTGRERGVMFGQPRWQQVRLRMGRWTGFAATFSLGAIIAVGVMLWQPWHGALGSLHR